jgi:predicted dehydrogenase
MRAAIIGAGFIGRVHARALRLLGVTLTGVVASTPATSEAAARELGAEQVFHDAATLIQHPQVDVVHICTPNHLHRPLAELAMAAGKHVVCEKPLGVSGAEAAALAERAREAGVIAAVPFAYRYHPMAREARARALSGALGRVHLVHGSYLQDWLLSASDGGWRVDAKLGGRSRAFADIGSHWCDLAEWATGQRITELVATTETVLPRRAVAAGPTFARSAPATPSRPAAPAAPTAPATATELREVTTEDVACLLFRTENTLGTLTVSQVSPGRKNRLWIEIDGSEAGVVFDQEQPESLWVGRRAASESLTRDGAALAPDASRLSILPPGHAQGFLDCFTAFLGEVYSAAAGEGEHGYPSFEDGLRVARLADAVLESARQRAWIKVEP